jgi:hypothetical protein
MLLLYSVCFSFAAADEESERRGGGREDLRASSSASPSLFFLHLRCRVRTCIQTRTLTFSLTAWGARVESSSFFLSAFRVRMMRVPARVRDKQSFFLSVLFLAAHLVASHFLTCCARLACRRLLCFYFQFLPSFFLLLFRMKKQNDIAREEQLWSFAPFILISPSLST